MKRDREFDDILNECIERVLKGESVKSCLAAYPEQAAELEPLLQTVVDTRKAAAVVPRPEFRQRAGYEFQAALRNIRPKQSGSFRWQVRLVTALSIIVVILMAGTGTVAAAGNSLPDEPLYSVKLATEEVRLALTPSALGKVELYTEFADRRVNEIIKMADKGKVAQLERVTVRMDKQLIAMANLNLPARETAIAVDKVPTTLMAPAVEPATASAGQAPAITAPATALTPAPASQENKGQLSPSANLSSPKATAKQEIKPAQVPMVATATALQPAAAEKGEKDNKVQADLKNTVSQQADKNAQQLEDVLKRVPDNVKPALKKAIDVAGKGYDEALKNIDKKK